VIEAIEHTGKSFAIGVQWHPEYKQMEGDVHLLAAFCAAAEAYHNR
jgi:putative glutamine amidotransferase